MGFFAECSPALQPGDAIDLKSAVLAGAYPEIIQRPAGKRRDAWFAAYIMALLQRDVRDLANIEGLTAHLAGVTRQSLDRDPVFFGHLFENFVVNELRKQLGWSDTRVNLHH